MTDDRFTLPAEDRREALEVAAQASGRHPALLDELRR